MAPPLVMLLLTAAALLATATAVPAQSLAAVAQISAPRAAGSKTYTNADLQGSAQAVSATAPAAVDASDPEPDAPAVVQPTPPPGRVVFEEDMGEGRINMIVKPEKSASSQNEPFWRKTIKGVKDRIAKSEADLVALDGRLGSASDAEREGLLQLRLKREHDLELLNLEYKGHLKRATALGVPEAWLR